MNGKSKIFEDIIDRMMLDYFDEDFKNKIRNLPQAKKRMMILCLLDKDRNLFMKAKDKIQDNKPKLKHIKDLILILREYVHVGEVEKKKHGEVMTPLELVEEMLATLPEEVWTNPDLKWLDSCNGTGPFLAMVVYKLMMGLKEWQPDEEKRYKHILENMIYAGELQAKNMFLWLTLMDIYDEYEMNIYCGSFLDKGFDDHMKNVWKVDKFDVIVGNPPYNLGQKAEGKRGGGDTLWDKFVMKSITNLKENGLLCYVHPTLWRKPQSEKSSSNAVNELMFKKQIHYLQMHNSEEGMKTFKAGTRYDYYLLENSDIYKKTKIKDENKIISNIDIRKYAFLPNKCLEFFDKIVAKKDDKRCPIIFNRTNYGSDRNYVIENEDEIHKYKLIHSTPQKGNRYLFSSRNDRGHFGISKVIFGESGVYDVIIDMDGNFGMSQGAMAIQVVDLKEAESIKKALMSDKFKDFLESVMWSNFRIDWRLFSNLKKDFWKNFI